MVAINYYTPTLESTRRTKMLSNDRAFLLEQIPGKDPISTVGMIDKRLFTGENKIHAVRDEASGNLWYFKYEQGVLPQDLQGQRFTKIDQAKKYLLDYYNKRNVTFREVDG